MDKKMLEYTLEAIGDIKGENTFYDIHAHPFEVMDSPITYVKSTSLPGLYSAGAAEYKAYEIADISLTKHKKSVGSKYDSKIFNKVKQLNRRRIYSHTGPRVFSDLMKLAKIDKVILLPVLAKDEFGDHQVQMLSDIFSDNDRFLLGYCVPNDIPVNNIVEKVTSIAQKYNIRILKIHPSLQGIDLSQSAGQERVEAILVASKEANLKVLIHGGLSPECNNPDAIAYGSVNKLQQIDWAITPETVVIAHAASFGYVPESFSRDVLPSLDRMLSRYANLVVDTAAIEIDMLSLVFENIEMDRIYFGSDSLYEKQWVAMVKVWHALQRSVRKPEDSLMQIASANPLKLFSGGNAVIK